MNLKSTIRRILKEETEIPLFIRRRFTLEDLEWLVNDVKDLINNGHDKTDAIYDTVRQYVAGSSFKFPEWSEQEYWDSYLEVEKPLVDYVKNKLGLKNDVNESELTEKCWKGYTQKGMKTMFGKRYPNCVKKTKK
jgi:hypothetical protein